MPKKKTWLDKLNDNKQPQVKRLEKDIAGMSAGSKMLIATPLLLDSYIRKIRYGKHVDTKTLRNDLAHEHHADCTCPLTTGIFLRIVAEGNYQKLQEGQPLEKIAPFWRVIEPGSPLAEKLTFGQDFLKQQIEKERGKK
jgi:hypothetical protein